MISNVKAEILNCEELYSKGEGRARATYKCTEENGDVSKAIKEAIKQISEFDKDGPSLRVINPIERETKTIGNNLKQTDFSVELTTVQRKSLRHDLN